MKHDYDDKELDGLFRDKLAGEEAAPRGMVWDKIEKDLDGMTARPSTWKWWLSGIILVLGIGIWLGVSMYQKKQLVENSKVTGWNYNDNVVPGSFEKAPYQTQEDEVKTNSDSTNSTSNLSSDNSSEKNSSDKISDSKNNSNNNLVDSKNSIASNPSSSKKHSKLNSDSKSKSIYSDNSGFEQNNPPLPDVTSGINIKSSNSGTKNSYADTHSKKQNGTTDDGSKLQLPQKLTDYAKDPKANTDTSLMPHIILDGTDLFNDVAQGHKMDSIAAKSAIGIILPKTDSANEKMVVKNDSLKKTTSNDSSKTVQAPPPAATNDFIFPTFFAAFNASVDAGKIQSSEFSTNGFTSEDVAVYSNEKHVFQPEQTYSYGGRFGWFATKHISIIGGGSYSIFSMQETGGLLKFKPNSDHNFIFHSPTSSVKLSSENFGWEDNNGMTNDTFYINVKAAERYDFVNLQLGAAFYALRTKHFGVYANLLSNGAFLAKEQMALTVPKSGKSFSFSGNQLSGMNKFVVGGQAGVGVEWNVMRSLGIWMEPSYYFSETINKENAVKLRPVGMRYSFGLAYHF